MTQTHVNICEGNLSISSASHFCVRCFFFASSHLIFPTSTYSRRTSRRCRGASTSCRKERWSTHLEILNHFALANTSYCAIYHGNCVRSFFIEFLFESCSPYILFPSRRRKGSWVEVADLQCKHVINQNYFMSFELSRVDTFFRFLFNLELFFFRLTNQ